MLKSQLLFGVSLAALGVAAAELAPYVPAPHQFQRVQTVPAAEIAVTAPDAAKKLTVGDFIKTRSLNGVWKCSGLETSARPIPADDGLDRSMPEPHSTTRSGTTSPYRSTGTRNIRRSRPPKSRTSAATTVPVSISRRRS